MATILMPLLDEGTDVWRPVEGADVSGDLYRVEGLVPEDERWAFAPGAVVRCEMTTFNGGDKGLAAMAPA